MANKFHAKKTTIDDIIFDSRKEAEYYFGLKNKKFLSNPTERVTNFERQVKIPIDIEGIHICNYFLDFKVEYADGRIEHIDIKGLKTGASYQIFRLKKKLVEAIYGIKIIEI